MLPPSQLADTLSQRSLAGTSVTFADPVLAEVVASNFEFVWIDLEHSAIDLADVVSLTITVQSTGCLALLRLPRSGWDRITAALDAGVDGIVIPQVNGAAEVAEVVSRLVYQPAGGRGYAPRRATRYGRIEFPGKTRPACVVQIETRGALESIDEIAAVPGVDCLFVSWADLGLALWDRPGPDPIRAPAVWEQIAGSAARAGVPLGVAATGSPGEIADVCGPQARMLLFASDARVIESAMRQAATTARAALTAAEQGPPP